MAKGVELKGPKPEGDNGAGQDDDQGVKLTGPRLVVQLVDEDSKPSNLEECYIESGEEFPPYFLMIWDREAATYRINYQGLTPAHLAVVGFEGESRSEFLKVQQLAQEIQRANANRVMRPGDRNWKVPPKMD